MDIPEPQSSADGRDRWEASTLHYAVSELRREFPTVAAERIQHAVELSAQTLNPSAGSVLLLQRAREHLSGR